MGNEEENGEKSDSSSDYTVFEYGDDCGYIYTDFTYPNELVGSAGENVCGILDQIKNTLGNYEYFYDEFGIFHFREIKNYLNTTQSKIVIDEFNTDDYLVDITYGKSAFTFTDNVNLVSLNHTPKYENIKNDFIVEGLRKSSDGKISYDVRYRLVIDSKPRPPYAARTQFLLYKDLGTGLTVGAFPLFGEIPDIGNVNLIYAEDKEHFYKWDGLVYQPVEIIHYYDDEGYTPEDWRTELYVQGLAAKKNGTDAGVYFAELEAGWPTVCDLEKQEINLNSEINYFLDFIDPSTSQLGQFSVANIGRRSNITIDNDINCLFAPEIPNRVFIDTSVDTPDKDIEDLMSQGYSVCQAQPHIFNSLATGGYANPALDKIKYDLYLHTNYQKSISVTAVPAYYLDANTRVTLHDASTNTYGDFMVNQITLPFGQNSLMSFNCSEVFERY